jgi:hypothetical protein
MFAAILQDGDRDHQLFIKMSALGANWTRLGVDDPKPDLARSPDLDHHLFPSRTTRPRAGQGRRIDVRMTWTW